MQQRQLVLVDAEARAQRRHLAAVEHVARPRSRDCGRPSSFSSAPQQRDRGAAGPVGQREGNVRGSSAAEQAEHRLDVRRVGGDVGHHHDHVARSQRGSAAKAASSWSCSTSTSRCGPCATWKRDRLVRAPASSARPGLRGSRPADAGRGCRPAAGAAACRRGVGVEAGRCAGRSLQRSAGPRPRGVVVHVEQADEVAPLLAPGGQQRLRVQVQRVRRQGALAARASRAAAGARRAAGPCRPRCATSRARRGCARTSAPASSAPAGQHLERLLRQRGDAEHHQPPRQPGGGARAFQLERGLRGL